MMKPIATGTIRGVSEDAQLLHAAVDGRDPLELINPIRLAPPLAPSVAARISRHPIDLKKVWSAWRTLSRTRDCVLVEGIGGILVPVLDRYPVARMAKRFGLPVLVVTRPTLGTINHTLLTVEAARAHGLRVIGLVINHHERIKRGLAERLNPATLEAECRVPVLAEIPFLGKKPLGARGRRAFDGLVKRLKKVKSF